MFAATGCGGDPILQSTTGGNASRHRSHLLVIRRRAVVSYNQVVERGKINRNFVSWVFSSACLFASRATYLPIWHVLVSLCVCGQEVLNYTCLTVRSHWWRPRSPSDTRNCQRKMGSKVIYRKWHTGQRDRDRDRDQYCFRYNWVLYPFFSEGILSDWKEILISVSVNAWLRYLNSEWGLKILQEVLKDT